MLDTQDYDFWKLYDFTPDVMTVLDQAYSRVAERDIRRISAIRTAIRQVAARKPDDEYTRSVEEATLAELKRMLLREENR